MRGSTAFAAMALALSVGISFSTGQALDPQTPATPTAPASAAPAPETPPQKREIKKESLDDVTQPHGELLLPLPGTDEARAGYLLNLSEGKLHLLPKPDDGKVLEATRTEHTGDLIFIPSDGGSLWAISGKISDLGTRYYYNLPNLDLPAPMEIPAQAGVAGSVAGCIGNIEEGHMYLVATTDGHFAAVRVLERQPGGVLIQYIYQPGNSINFTQPKHDLIAVHTPQVLYPSSMGAGPQATVPHTGTDLGPGKPPTVLTSVPYDPMEHTLTPTYTTNLLQREKLIRGCLDTLASISTMDEAIQRKCDAIDQLGQLGLPPAADLNHGQLGVASAPDLAAKVVQTIIDNITTAYPQARQKPFSPENYYPAIGALRQFGKPASVAAVGAIGTLTPDAQKDDPQSKIRLLELVIVGVEGPEVAEFMLTRAMDQADASHKPLFEKAIKYLRQP